MTTVSLPEKIGLGRITGLRTPQKLSLSSWNMKYYRDTQVEGCVGYDMRLLFCLGEGIEWKTDRRMIRMDGGYACFCMDENDHESMCYPNNSDFMFRSIAMPRIHFSAMLQKYNIAPSELFSSRAFTHFRILPEMYKLLDHFNRLEYMEEGIEMMRLDAAMHELIIMCLKTVKQDDIKPKNIPSAEIRSMQHLKYRIEADPGSVPSIHILAQDYGFSTSKLTRLFKDLYGKSLHAYVIEARLSEAARMLKEGSLSISEIAEHTGYAKSSQFSAAFKKRFGVLPSDF